MEQLLSQKTAGKHRKDPSSDLRKKHTLSVLKTHNYREIQAFVNEMTCKVAGLCGFPQGSGGLAETVVVLGLFLVHESGFMVLFRCIFPVLYYSSRIWAYRSLIGLSCKSHAPIIRADFESGIYL
jgi:hypothetical protein